MERSDLMTVDEVAGRLGMHPKTVYRLCMAGEIPSVKVGRSRKIRTTTYLKWLSQLEQQTQSQ